MATRSNKPTLFTETIPNLVGGVSQKPAALRLPSQGAEITNALLSPSEGFLKRPPTNYLQNISSLFGGVFPDGGCFTHTYKRDEDEKYILVIVNGDLKVYSLIDGVSQTITFPDGKAYLASDSARADFRAVTVGDYTFIVNRTITVDDLATVSPAVVYEALVWVRIGDYGVDYSVTLDGTTYRVSTDLSHRDEVTTEFITNALYAKIPNNKGTGTFSLGSGYAIGDTVTITRTSAGGGAHVYTVKAGADGLVESVHEIARGLSDVLNRSALGTGGSIIAFPVFSDDVLNLTDGLVISNLVSGEVYTWSIATSGAASPAATNTTQANTYTVTRAGSTLYIKRVNGADFSISASDGLGDQSIRAIKGQIQRFEDLPARAVDGFRVEVTGEERSLSDNFHVIYSDASTADNDGVWKESLKGNELIALNPATMPHVLIRNSDGTFTFQEAEWSNRLVGDLLSNPFPSFVGQKISDVFLFKNRLGLTSGENVVLSQDGEYFNLFRKSVMQLLDEDIIDIALATTEYSPIRHTVPHSTHLLLWSDKDQFALSGQPTLTAKTVQAPAITSFESSSRTEPIKAGSDVFFSVDRGSATKVMQYYQEDESTKPDAFNITEDVPSYLAASPRQISASDNLDMVGVLVDEATSLLTNCLFIYNHKWVGNRQIQGAWSKWPIAYSGARIYATEFMDSRLYLIVQRNTVVTLEVMDIQPAYKDEYSVHATYLDLRMTNLNLTSTYDAGTNKTTWTLPFAIVEHASNPLKVCRRATVLSTDTTELSGITRPSTTTIAAMGNHTATEVWVGFQYEQKFEFSTLYKREQSEDGREVAVTDSQTQVRHLNLKYANTGYFKVEVTPEGRSTAYVYTVDESSNVAEGTLKVPVLANNERVSIVLKNISHRPCNILGATWVGTMSHHTR